MLHPLTVLRPLYVSHFSLSLSMSFTSLLVLQQVTLLTSRKDTFLRTYSPNPDPRPPLAGGSVRSSLTTRRFR